MRSLAFFEFRQLLSSLTIARLVNACLVLSSYYLHRVGKNFVPWGKPISISIEPTTACNLGCPECPSGLKSFTRPVGKMTYGLFTKVVDEMSNCLIYLILYFQGEPYLNPDFFKFVTLAKKRRIYVATSSNGHFLNLENARKTVESGLDKLIISIDGTTQETYQSYRKGGQLKKVLKGTENILYWKQKLNSATPFLVWQFIVFKTNQHQIKEVKEWGKNIGVDKVSLKTAQIYDYNADETLIPDSDKYSRYRKTEKGYVVKNTLANHCWKMWHSSVITWDGRVVPCCFDKDASHQMGEVSKEKFTKIWSGDRYRQFRKKIFRGRRQINICKNCTEGTKVWG